MVDRIGSGGGGLQREAILAALRKQATQTDEVHKAAELVSGDSGAARAAGDRPSFAGALKDGISAVNGEIRNAERLPEDIALGKVDDFHEVAARLKRADLSFKFAMEVRNKLIDAYREVMRMPV